MAASAASAGPRYELAYTAKTGTGSAIFVVRADGGAPRRLARDGAWPAWSPDGRRLAFVSSRTGNSDVFVLDASEGRARPLTRDRGEDVLPSWSPDGERIAFASNRSGGYEIYVVARNGGRARRVTRGASPAYGSFWPAWSPDGRLIAFSSSAWTPENQEIYVIRPDGSGRRRLTRTRGDSETLGDDAAPSWSPEGRRIVFTSNRTGEGEIWIMRADGRDQRRLLGLPRRDDGAPRFSPDGQWLVFDSRGAGTSDLYLARKDGTGLRRLRAGESGAWRPRWSRR